MFYVPASSARLVSDWEGKCRAWTRGPGLPDVLADSSVALIASRGTNVHHDGGAYGAAAFLGCLACDDFGSYAVFDRGYPQGPARRAAIACLILSSTSSLW